MTKLKRVMLVGAAVLSLVVVVGALLLYLNRDKITAYAVDRALSKVEEQVLQNIPDPKAAHEAKLQFAALHERLQRGTVKSDDVKDLAATFYNKYREGKIDTLTARQLVEQVQRLAEKQ